MHFNHIGLFNESAQQAEEFYGKILGFDKVHEFTVNKSLAELIFNIEDDLKVLVFKKAEIKFEIFISAKKYQAPPKINHVCLEVPDPEQIVKKCEHFGAEVIKIARNEKTLIFIKDFYGNLFEITQLT